MYELNDTIDQEFQPTLDAYGAKAQEGYGQEMAAPRRTALRELEAEISGQDLQGRQAGYLRRATYQGFGEADDKFRADLGMKRADLGETLRERGQDRLWAVEDRDNRLSRLRQEADQQRKLAYSSQRNELMGTVMGGVGTIVGGVVGGYFGNAPGAVAGAGAGAAGGKSIGEAL